MKFPQVTLSDHEVQWAVNIFDQLATGKPLELVSGVDKKKSENFAFAFRQLAAGGRVEMEKSGK